jgi:hypothetical protein
VFSLYPRLSAIALILALVTAAGAPVLAAELHPTCAARHHDCGKVATIKACCCGDQGDPSNPSSQAESRAPVTPDVAPVIGVPSSTVSTAPAMTVVHVHASPLRPPRLDLPTLFATLLI